MKRHCHKNNALIKRTKEHLLPFPVYRAHCGPTVQTLMRASKKSLSEVDFHFQFFRHRCPGFSNISALCHPTMPADWSINDENHFPFAVWRVIGGAAQSNRGSLAAFNMWAITVAGCNIHILRKSSGDKRRCINASQNEMNDNGGSESNGSTELTIVQMLHFSKLSSIGYSPQITHP